MPPAHAADNLLIRQHSSALRTPVHPALLAICQPRFKEFQEKPLIPAVVIGQASRDFTRPVVGEAKAVHLHLHGRDISQRPLFWRSVVLDRCVLRRQAKRIPAHGMKHVVAVHPHITGERVADRVVAHVAHVQRAGRVGEHLQHVILRLRRMSLGRVQRRIALPARSPFLFNALRIVSLVARRGGRLFFLFHR